MDCIFCKIVSGDIPAKKVYEDDFVLAFWDINPMAKVHILLIPKTHISSAAEVDENTENLIGKVFTIAAKLAKEMDLDDGFRIVTNCKQHGCQSVNHLHFHLIGGEQLSPKLG